MALSISQSRSYRIINGTMLEHPLSFSPYEKKKQFIDQTNLIRKLHLLPFFYIFYLLIILIKWIICFINLNKVVFLFIRLKRFCWIKRCFPCLRSLRSTNESFSKESCIFFSIKLSYNIWSWSWRYSTSIFVQETVASLRKGFRVNIGLSVIVKMRFSLGLCLRFQFAECFCSL